jgi:hypothetical protein
MKRNQRICFYSKKAEKPVFPLKATAVTLEDIITHQVLAGLSELIVRFGAIARARRMLRTARGL